jgi:hypothetical protein
VLDGAGGCGGGEARAREEAVEERDAVVGRKKPSVLGLPKHSNDV